VITRLTETRGDPIEGLILVPYSCEKNDLTAKFLCRLDSASCIFEKNLIHICSIIFKQPDIYMHTYIRRTIVHTAAEKNNEKRYVVGKGCANPFNLSCSFAASLARLRSMLALSLAISKALFFSSKRVFSAVCSSSSCAFLSKCISDGVFEIFDLPAKFELLFALLLESDTSPCYMCSILHYQFSSASIFSFGSASKRACVSASIFSFASASKRARVSTSIFSFVSASKRA